MVRSACALIEEGEISRGVRFLHSLAQGLGVVDLDEDGVLEQLKRKHPARRRHVRPKGAAELLVFGVRALLHEHRAEAGARKIDIVNAFNEFDRHDVIALMADKRHELRQVEAWGEEQVRELQALVPLAWAMMSVGPVCIFCLICRLV